MNIHHFSANRKNHRPEFLRNKLVDHIITVPLQEGEDEIMKLQFLTQWFLIKIENSHDAMGVMLAGGEL